MPSALRFGANVGEGLLLGLLSDYANKIISGWFDRRDFEDQVKALEPDIKDFAELVYKGSPAKVRASIDVPVTGEPKFYWIIQLKIRTTTHVTTRVILHSMNVSLVSVGISTSPAEYVSPLREEKPTVAPALHPVILVPSYGIVTYSEPIVSWGPHLPDEIGNLLHQAFSGTITRAYFESRLSQALNNVPKEDFLYVYLCLERMRPVIESMFSITHPPAEPISALRWYDTGKRVTNDELLAWAKERLARGKPYRYIIAEIMHSWEFSGSDETRGDAVMDLDLRLREERQKGR